MCERDTVYLWICAASCTAGTVWCSAIAYGTPVRLSFHPMAKEHVHALKGLACRKRVAAASSPAATCKQDAALTSPARHACGCARLLAHACVTETVNFCPMGPKLRRTMVCAASLACDVSMRVYMQVSVDFIVTVTFSSVPEMNNYFQHDGSPPISYFSCDASRVTSGACGLD